MCARSKATRHSFIKVYKFRGNNIEAFVSVDIPDVVNRPFREGCKYVVGFTDHVTKRSWVCHLNEITEFVSILKDLNFVQLNKFRDEIEHYHDDGGKKLTNKETFGILKGIGASYSFMEL